MVLDIKYVLVLGDVGTKCTDILNAHNIMVTKKGPLTEKELIEEIPAYDALVVRFSTRVTFDVLFAAKNLKVIACAGAYFGNIDICAAKNMGIGVINAPNGDSLSLCEYICCLIMSLPRHVMKASTTSFASLWDRGLYMGSELKGRTMALIGFNEAARQVARRMSFFGSVIICYDPRLTNAQCKRYSAIKMELNQIWPIADYIIIYTEPFDSLRTYIDADILRKCKKGVNIIIAGRFTSFDISAMYDGLNTGQVSGAAFDLYDEDLTLLRKTIFRHPSVIASMHLGVQTEEATVRSGQQAAEQLVNLCYPDNYETPLSTIVKFPNKLPYLVTPFHC